MLLMPVVVVDQPNLRLQAQFMVVLAAQAEAEQVQQIKQEVHPETA